ncbi:MAG: hypothetical protein IKV16_03990 [Clostridia bacterium]|nr:hypothetical protein [Clostridia bacterium]
MVGIKRIDTTAGYKNFIFEPQIVASKNEIKKVAQIIDSTIPIALLLPAKIGKM